MITIVETPTAVEIVEQPVVTLEIEVPEIAIQIGTEQTGQSWQPIGW